MSKFKFSGRYANGWLLCVLWSWALACLAVDASSRTELPPRNPFLADSPAAIFHADPSQTDVSEIPGPISNTRKIDASAIVWKKIGPGDGYSIQYSGVYPNGRRVGWFGGGQQLVKLDADTLETLSTYILHSGKFYSPEEIEKLFIVADQLQGQPLFDVLVPPLTKGIERGVQAAYRLLDKNNDLYMLYTDRANGDQYIRQYGDAIKDDPDSDIVLKAEFKLPRQEKQPFVSLALNITHDGWLIVVTRDGTLFAVSRDFKQISTIQLPDRESKNKEFMNSFVRNSLAIDADGGIYIVTRTQMHRVQWTGKKLSVDPADGAWSINYPTGKRGSGTTPTLMGWHEGQDKLVLIGDGEGVLMAIWRDTVPKNWVGIEGYAPRVAAVSSMQFGDDPENPIKLENALVVIGDGVFVANDTPDVKVPWQGSYLATAIAERYLGYTEGTEIKGGIKWQWNSDKRSLDIAWTTPLALVASICTPNVNGLLYCGGLRKGVSTIEALDWQTGAPVFHYLLGKSFRYSNMGGLFSIAPNGDIECGCAGGYGVIRVHEADIEKK